ncbi:MAG TPA: SURF1 family protein [Ramlibacter sp.]|nr:SURF1 family protein [Ramlibacter sp.]
MLKRLLIALAAAIGIAATVALGAWQWGRAQQKLALEAAIQQRQALAAIGPAELLAAQADPAPWLHRTVELRGQWLPEHTVYLDNRQMHGKPGFYVLTPLRLDGNARVVLVQRGWVQRDFQRRDRLPPVQTPAGPVQVRGRLAPPPAKLYAFQAEETGPIRQNLDLSTYRAETGLPLLQLSVQQTGAASEGLLREWPQPASGADKNYGYAFQWWALAVLIAILYAWFQFLLPRRRQARGL